MQPPLATQPTFDQPLEELVEDPSTWARLELDSDQVALFGDLLAGGDPEAVPPIELVILRDGRPLVAEGHQRVAAARGRGIRTLRAIRLPVPEHLDPRDIAYDRSLETAVQAPKPLSMVERRRAAERMLTDHPGRPDREIGRRVGLSHQTIGRVRTALAGPSDHVKSAAPNGDRGATYPATADELAQRLVRDITKLWDGRGFTDVLNDRLARNLADVLVDRFGEDEALIWARRLAAWTTDAVARLEAS
jgi:ParB-like chromosome segregation protein Spo0J